MILTLLPLSHEFLHRACLPFDFEQAPIKPLDLYNSMAETMTHMGGLGLAANQVGHSCRFFVIRSSPILGFFNPKIISISSDLVLMDEGCLTVPGIHVKIKRPSKLRMEFQDASGKIYTDNFEGLTARIIFHELDHLDGILFTERCSRLQLDMAIKRAKKAGHSYNICDLRK